MSFKNFINNARQKNFSQFKSDIDGLAKETFPEFDHSFDSEFENFSIPEDFADFNNFAESGKGLSKLFGTAFKQHPIASSVGLASSAGNIYGLFDNNKVLGQIGGAAAGSLLGGLGMASGLLPYQVAPILSGIGGNIGMFIDKKRAKTAQQREDQKLQELYDKLSQQQQ